jgi:sugar lactone lactonase YvrE
MKEPAPSFIDKIDGELLESPVWSAAEQALYLVDIRGRRLIRYEPARDEVRDWKMPGDAGCVALMREPGRVAVALRSGLFAFDIASEVLDPLAPPDYDVLKTRFNDGSVDRDGRLWIGTIYEPRDRRDAALYRYDGSGAPKRVREGFTTTNGLACSLDGRTLYAADTPQRKVWAFDLDETGEIQGERLHIDFESAQLPGRPDGATVDAEDCYWLALIDAGRVARFDPAGKLMQSIEVPVRWPTKPCFGGADLRTLYVTSLRTGRDPAQLAASPRSGTLVAVDAGVTGVAENIAAF